MSSDSRKKNLFLDSNIWLSMFHFTSDDLEQFSKLMGLLETDINLFIPSQVRNEVMRNRESKIKDALDKFVPPSTQFPTFCKNYEEYKNYFESCKKLKEEYSRWRKIIDDDIKKNSLPADQTINSFFEAVSIIECDDELVSKAVTRFNCGNPPGKDHTYGDAINWECLLATVPDGEDLYFISADKDFLSELDSTKFSQYLEWEWNQKKHSRIVFYKTLVPFLNEHFKTVKLRAEEKKEELIRSLKDSPNFATTHLVIKELGKNSDWTEQQIEELCDAVVENTQVGWILGDADVFEFYNNLLEKELFERSFSQNAVDVYSQLEKIKKETQEQNLLDEDIPF